MQYKWSTTEQNRLIYRAAIEHNLWILVRETWYHPDRWFKQHGNKDIPISKRANYKLRNPLSSLKESCRIIHDLILSERDRVFVVEFFNKMRSLAIDLAEWGYKEVKHQKESHPVPWKDAA